MIITRGLEVSALRRNAARAGSLFLRSTVFNVGRTAVVCVALSALLCSAGPASATVLTDGGFTDATDPGTAVGDPTAGGPTTLAATQSPTVVGGDGGLTPTSTGWTATVTSSVYFDSPNNPYYNGTISSVDNAMTFVYQISVISPYGDVAELDAASFGANGTDVGYYAQNGLQDEPYYFARNLASPTADTVSFFFVGNGGQYNVIGPGETSALLVVNTDAVNFTASSVELQDGINATTSSFAIYAPMYSTPEPASVVLMVFGLTGLLVVARSRRSGRTGMRTGS